MLRLRYRATTTIPVEAECLTPDNLAGKSAAEIAFLPVQHGNAPAPSASSSRWKATPVTEKS